MREGLLMRAEVACEEGASHKKRNFAHGRCNCPYIIYRIIKSTIRDLYKAKIKLGSMKVVLLVTEFQRYENEVYAVSLHEDNVGPLPINSCIHNKQFLFCV